MKKETVFKMALVICIAILVYEFGFKAFISETSSRTTADKKENWAIDKLASEEGIYDVVVVGDEPDGIAAAVAASRSGAKTLLISESTDMGGIISRGLYPKLESSFGQRGESISKGIFAELYKKIGDEFNVEDYLAAVWDLLKNEKNLALVYDAKGITPILSENTVVGIQIDVNGKETRFKGKRFIDSTKGGVILAACNVPYSNIHKELNLNSSIVPARLNFKLAGVDYKDIKKVMDLYKDDFFKELKNYKAYNLNISLNSFKVYPSGENGVIIQGLEVTDLDGGDPQSVMSAYNKAVDEAKNFSAFLTNKFQVFATAKFSKAADTLVMPEVNHFLGEKTLSVVEIMENKDFKDKIALGAHPVETYLENKRRYYVVKPVQYGIPLGCFIPQKIENLLITGGKASYSALAATSSDKISVNMVTGQSAGVVAVYSLTRGMTPREIIKEKDSGTIKEVKKLLVKQGVFLPDFSIENKNSALWCYDSLKKLVSLGLVSCGTDNDFKFDMASKEQDLAYILLNGVYRLSPDKYSYSFDASIRPYIRDNTLTKEKTAEMLLAFHGVKPGQGELYSEACKKQYIDHAAQARLKGKSTLAMEDVYYLGAYNIRLYTGKNITY